MLLGGVHGNELTGIEVVRSLIRSFDDGTLQLTAGTLTLALGNPEAIRLGSRATAPYADLNRSFAPQRLARPATYEERRAAELAPFIASADVLIDIHATNKPSRPFVVATAHDARRAALAARFACDDFLVAPDAVIGGTTDGWISAHGGIGLGYESGLADDTSKVATTRSAVLDVLADLGLLARRHPARMHAQRVTTLDRAVMFTGASFAFAAGKGLASFEPFRRGEVIAVMDGAPVTAPYDGLLMFPKPDRLRHPGLPAGFLAKTARTCP